MGLGCASRLSVPSGSCPSEDETSARGSCVCLTAQCAFRLMSIRGRDLVGLGVHPSSVAKRRQNTKPRCMFLVTTAETTLM